MRIAENRTTVTESSFPWEWDAPEFERAQIPAHTPYRAWSNFEFIDNDGNINEVDLLVLTKMGIFLVGIERRPGLITGDAGTWIWDNEGKRLPMTTQSRPRAIVFARNDHVGQRN